MAIDKTNSIPYHIQVRNEILNAIRSGEYTSGDRLASERELQDKYGISRLTVRAALATLERDGIIYSRQGKGRYVTQAYFDQQLMHLSGFSQDMQQVGIKPGSHLIFKGEIPAPTRVAESLQIVPGTHIAHIIRVRCADNQPMAIEDAHLPLSLCPDILEMDFEKGSIYAYLNSRGLRPVKAAQSLKADNPTREERQLLNLKENIPVMRMKRTTSLVNMVPIEYVESVYRSDKYQFNVILTLHDAPSMTGRSVNNDQ